MHKEIERKFLVKKLPDLKQRKFINIEQGYLCVDPQEVRLRIKDNCYILEIKGKGGLTRTESDPVYLDAKQFEALWPYVICKLKKKLYEIPYGGFIIELAEYLGNLKGLYVVEVEFKDEQQASNFIPPKWFGPEVTNYSKFKNCNLAIRSNYETIRF